MSFRIGVHMGDVIEKVDGTVYGDGVNIAARLEAKAPPGGICISQTVYDTVKGKVPMQATSMGPENFKNIAEPISVWHVNPEGTVSASPLKPVTDLNGPTTLLGKLKPHKGAVAAIAGTAAIVVGVAAYWNVTHFGKIGVNPTGSSAAVTDVRAFSIVVLPFVNLTGDASQTFVADGLTASVTSDLSRIRDAFVIDARTAFAYKDKSVSVQQIGRDLAVQFVLQGNVQRSGTKIRINAQLADATINAQLWSDSFHGDQSDLFALQDLVTTRIANSIGPEMILVKARESEVRKGDPKAADLILRARALSLKPQTSLENFQQIEALYRQVLALDPDNATAMAGLANVLIAQADNFSTAMDKRARERKYAEGLKMALKAKEIDPDNQTIYIALGTYADGHDDFDGARRAAETYFSLSPKSLTAHNNLAVSLMDGGEPRRALELLTKGFNLDPKHASVVYFVNLARANFMLGDNPAAIEWCLKSLENNPAFPYTYTLLAMAYALNGDDAKARSAVANLRRVDPKFKLSDSSTPKSSGPAAYKEWYEKKYLPAWRKAGLPE